MVACAPQPRHAHLHVPSLPASEGQPCVENTTRTTKNDRKPVLGRTTPFAPTVQHPLPPSPWFSHLWLLEPLERDDAARVDVAKEALCVGKAHAWRVGWQRRLHDNNVAIAQPLLRKRGPARGKRSRGAVWDGWVWVGGGKWVGWWLGVSRSMR
eukprot:314401-Chlamydomonas_euryale.AAC.1